MRKLLATLVARLSDAVWLSTSKSGWYWRCRDKLALFNQRVFSFFVFAALMTLSLPSHAALEFTFNAEDEGSRPGEGIQVEWIVTNTGTVQESNISVELPFPTPGISTLSESLTDGGDCPGTVSYTHLTLPTILRV